MAKILIVDDSGFTRNLIRRFLEDVGHEIVGYAANGEQAVQLFKSVDPDLVVLDYLLPDINGDVVLEQILKLEPKARVIVISGSGHHAIAEKVLRIGAKMFLEKTHLHVDILKAIDSVMET